MKSLLGSIIAVLVLSGCASRPSHGVQGRSPAETAAELLSIDREFARVAAGQGASFAFALFSDERSLRINPSGPNTVGRTAFVAELQDLPAGALVC